LWAYYIMKTSRSHEEDNTENLAHPPSQKQWCYLSPNVRCLGWSCFVSALHSITEYMSRRMQSVADGQGFWTS
jgi:hypothetical protein